jgi:hypothetical protein
MFDIIRHSSRNAGIASLMALSLLVANAAYTQTPAPLGAGQTAEWNALSAEELDALVGPIALYPDDLVAIVLPASTYPLEIVQASRFLEQRGSNPSLEPDPDWDDSIVALLNYPEALDLLNDDLDWTYDLGEAVVYQQGDVLNAIQSFRDRAQAAGNLTSDGRQVVATADDGAITISPAEPDVIYVPYYDPARVVVHTAVPSYYYYPYAYPVYYYPYPAGYSFGSGFFWGVTTAFLVSWHDDYLHVRHHSQFGHPYFGYSYYTPWYARTNVYVNINHYGSYDRWQPSYRHGGRPRHPSSYSRLRDETVVRTPRERRIRSGWVPNQTDSGGTGTFASRRAPVNAGAGDDGRTRRIRSGRYDANAMTNSRDTTTSYRRPRGTAGAPAASTPAGTTAAPADARRDWGSGRVRMRDPNASGASRGASPRGDLPVFGRVAPERGASAAARGLQTSPPASMGRLQRVPSATGGGIAAGAARVPGARREQPMTPPAARNSGSRAAPTAAPQARSGNSVARGQPRAAAPRSGESGRAQHQRRVK